MDEHGVGIVNAGSNSIGQALSTVRAASSRGHHTFSQTPTSNCCDSVRLHYHRVASLSNLSSSFPASSTSFFAFIRM